MAILLAAIYIGHMWKRYAKFMIDQTQRIFFCVKYTFDKV